MTDSETGAEELLREGLSQADGPSETGLEPRRKAGGAWRRGGVAQHRSSDACVTEVGRARPDSDPREVIPLPPASGNYAAGFSAADSIGTMAASCALSFS